MQVDHGAPGRAPLFVIFECRTDLFYANTPPDHGPNGTAGHELAQPGVHFRARRRTERIQPGAPHLERHLVILH